MSDLVRRIRIAWCKRRHQHRFMPWMEDDGLWLYRDCRRCGLSWRVRMPEWMGAGP